jgi:TonB family protein
VSSRSMRRWVLTGLLLVAAISFVSKPSGAAGEEAPEITRKVKSKIAPMYPEIARRMNITGTVKLVVVVSATGTVKSTKVLGGHPLLVNAAEDAIKKWKFEPASDESSGVVEFTFKPEN